MPNQAGISEATSDVIRDRPAVIGFDALARRFGLTKLQLAETVGISRDAVYKKARLEGPKAQGRLREAVEIIDRVRGWAGGDLQALTWYRAWPIPALGGRTAEALVKDGRAATVRDWLDAVAVGTFH